MHPLNMGVASSVRCWGQAWCTTHCLHARMHACKLAVAAPPKTRDHTTTMADTHSAEVVVMRRREREQAWVARPTKG